MLTRLSSRLRVPRELLTAQPPSVILHQCSSRLSVTVAQSGNTQPPDDSQACNAASVNASLELLLRNATGTRTMEAPASTAALVIIDMWQYHWCKTAQARTESLVPRVKVRDATSRFSLPLLLTAAASHCHCFSLPLLHAPSTSCALSFSLCLILCLLFTVSASASASASASHCVWFSLCLILTVSDSQCV